jgi:hypothetical protein
MFMSFSVSFHAIVFTNKLRKKPTNRTINYVPLDFYTLVFLASMNMYSTGT